MGIFQTRKYINGELQPGRPASIYADVPDTEGLPDGYQGTPPPSGWCSTGTTFYVAPELRPAYLDQLNDQAAEQDRKANLWRWNGRTVSIPARINEDRPANEVQQIGPNYCRLVTINLNSDEGYRIALHLARLEAAEARVNGAARAAGQRQAFEALTAARRCSSCGTVAAADLPGYRDTGQRLCPKCIDVADRWYADLLAGDQVQHGNTTMSRSDAVYVTLFGASGEPRA